MSARLLSVNVGLPRDVEWEGRTVHTGIWKESVSGPRMVRRLNVDGDGQGDMQGHGGPNRPVFVYQTESYRHWEEELGRDDFTPGQFGENFTVEGLPDDEVCIGDRYRIGTALFEVSQPRVTCYRVGIRMDEPRMPALLVSHRRPGFYLRVLEEGEVEAGDEIEQVATGAEEMTVAEIDGLLYLPRPSRRGLERALRIPALSEGWQGSFREMVERASGEPVSAPAWEGLRDLRVAAIDQESETVISVRLEPVDAAPVEPPLPGQFLTVRLQPDPAGAPLLRSYSLSDSPAPAAYRISVKREAHGAASGYIHSAVQVGDVIQAGAPRGDFVLQAGERPVVLISAGVGATPVMAMLHVLASEGSTRSVWWLHAARSRAEQAFAAEARDLLARLPDAHPAVFHSAPGPDEEEGVDFEVAGRLTGAALGNLGVPVDADYYICGPVPFMHDMGAALTARGVAPNQVRTEIFGPEDPVTPGVVGAPVQTPHPPPGTPGEGPVVSFSRSNLAVPWDDSFGSLLELAEACDVPVQWSCRTGVCHTCATGLVSGAVDYRPEPLEAAEPGDALICCSRPAGEVILDL